ncbi:MAG: hypothetical protein ABW168_10515 [Sedimenticola sp.]
MKKFDYYIKAAGVNKDEQKRALLLHIAGPEIQDVFETFDDQGSTFTDAAAQLSTYFAPKKTISYERHVFHQEKQHDEETIDNYIVRLSKLAISCEFPDKNDMVRDQVVNTCKSSHLRRKFLEQPELTLDKVQSIARTFDLSETHVRRMTEPTTQNDELYRIHRNNQRGNQRTQLGNQQNQQNQRQQNQGANPPNKRGNQRNQHNSTENTV